MEWEGYHLQTVIFKHDDPLNCQSFVLEFKVRSAVPGVAIYICSVTVLQQKA
jgi:hypothetical protein